MIITNEDLRKNKYSLEELENNIHNFNLKTLLINQTLTASFCAKYILSEEYASRVEETYIDSNDVLGYQPHISDEELSKAFCEYMNQKS